MDITSVTITPEGNYLVALADGRLLAVPDDPANADRQAVAAWEAAGGVIAAPAVDLEEAKAEALARIDAAAEAVRLQLITPGSGQAMAYLAKEAEARAWQDDPDPEPANYPFLAAETADTREDMATTAGIILARAKTWRQAGAAVEGVRLEAKRAVREAEDAAGVAAVLAGLKWPQIPAGQ
ncbi:MAG: hypothetical protein KQJ78_07740 [Deltaproteobacteria bacterium]|nr:hypothetical protein [Deltaproteobacteria bacterium]